ncbi:MAG TPA: manno-octulosonate cytidylyltransferase [Allosphingosinicella sp.]|nr:manno-octulosonate cytidylyltransferase [Allosphingosinicella sp.]
MTTGASGAVIIVPARYESSRYPAKPLAPLCGRSGRSKPLIQRSWEAAKRVPGIAAVYIATDHADIAAAARGFGADVLMTSSACRNGTERCAEALDRLGAVPDLVINLQGDAPLTPPHFVSALIAAMPLAEAPIVATPAVAVSAAHFARLEADQAAGRVGGTSVVADANGRALYFSKRLIPYFPTDLAGQGRVPLRLHIGVYAYTPAALRDYCNAPPSSLERIEGLEQLRFLELGIPVRIVDVAPPAWEMWELNNPADVEPIEAALAMMGEE